jgi:RND family efflux transporter MFP subunit
VKNQNKSSFVKYLVFVLILILMLVLVLFFTRKKEVVAKAETIPVVVVQKPIITNLQESIEINGYVEANAMIPIVPFVAGTILEYPVKAGDFVEKDTLLAKIDDAPFTQQLKQAEAAFYVAENSFKRVEALYNSGSTTLQNYDSVKAQRDASKAQYDLAKLQVDYTNVKASVSGTVLMADLAVGSVASQSQPVAVLADLENQVVRLSVPEKYYDLFSLEKENLVVSVTRPAEKNMYDDAVTSATIENIAPYIAAQSKTFQVVCKLDNPGERFRPGMYVKVLITYKNYVDVPILPMKTKKMDGSLYIYHPESKTVEFIPPAEYATDNEFFIVPEKYKDTFFVVDGQNSLFDGQQVRIFDEVIGEY